MGVMTPIVSRIFLGSVTDAVALKRENPRHIKTVVSCADFELNFGPEHNITHYALPFEDGEPVPPATLDRCLSAIWSGVREGNVLVHCAAGISRSPAIVAAYLHRAGIFEFDDAIPYIKGFRPIVSVHPKIASSIKYTMQIFPYTGQFGEPYEGKKN